MCEEKRMEEEGMEMEEAWMECDNGVEVDEYYEWLDKLHRNLSYHMDYII